MSESTPESLLQSALEKILYFEARSKQLVNDLDTARSEAERSRDDATQSAQREIELRRTLAELEVRLTRAHAEREEYGRANDALRRERADLIGKVLEASRIQNAGSGADGYDLAQFIATLRMEVAVPGTPLSAVDVTPAKDIMSVATELRSQGRLEVTEKDMGALEANHPFDGRSEETLFGFSVRELSAPDSASRARAAERLKALKHPAAAPALATALHAESDAKTQVALLGAISALGGPEAATVVVPLTSSSSPEVRVAALKALLALDAPRAAPHLAAAMKDPDKAVRRRASLLALGLTGKDALELGSQAIRDADADVRALGVLVLGASGVPAARTLLTQAMRDPELRVRRSASQALSRVLGQDVTPLANLDDAQRRREVRRLASVQAHPVQAVAPSRLVAAAPVARPEVTRPTAAPAGMGAQPMRSRIAVIDEPVAVAPIAPETKQAILTELRATLRGRPIEDLSSSAGIDASTAQRALSELMASAQVVRRGTKYFVA